MSHTREILAFASASHALPAKTRENTVRLLADTLAVGAAGLAAPAATALLSVASGWGAGGDARLLGAAGRVPAPTAAFVNGFAIHCLEWDAVHEVAVVHALSAVTAAVLAASDRRGDVDADALLTAIAVGVDVAAGLGVAATGAMRFFRPATAGVIGAALAAARIDGLEAHRFADVLGLAFAFASGTMQSHVEASLALPLQVANAARGALTAVDLARAGLDGPKDALEGPFGYAALLEPLDLARYTSELDTRWRIDEVSVKPFPSGRASHGALGAIGALREERGLGLGDVVRVDLYAPPLIHRLVGRPWRADMSPAYARLCLALLAPMMLRDGVIDPDLFTGESLAAPDLSPLAAQTRVLPDGNEDQNAMAPQRLVLTLKSGEVVEHAIPATLGSPEAPLDASQGAVKRALCRRLAGGGVDPRLFDDPLSYATEPA